ncbi:helix-turn-helix domain-containing protein [Mycetocola miduiensis]|uniref:helix-turn-helix domain-containing protein n=1 Tax=Mycetocola miduiensis TaxID=995034 RepID=UPI0015A5CBF9|nr:helix-turn-helix transcriptional regulator [Mycetocola miduiensis]
MPSVKKTPGAYSRNIAAILRREAELQGVSQTALGESIGLSQAQISRIFGGKRVLDVDQVQGLCDLLGLPFESVMQEAAQAVARDSSD